MSEKRESVLAGLHDKLAQALVEKITSEEATAKDFEVALKFLSHNNINIDGLLAGDETEVGKLTNTVKGLKMPFDNEEAA